MKLWFPNILTRKAPPSKCRRCGFQEEECRCQQQGDALSRRGFLGALAGAAGAVAASRVVLPNERKTIITPPKGGWHPWTSHEIDLRTGAIFKPENGSFEELDLNADGMIDHYLTQHQYAPLVGQPGVVLRDGKRRYTTKIRPDDVKGGAIELPASPVQMEEDYFISHYDEIMSNPRMFGFYS